jgi:choline dehydrogenase-like flavoprotein
MAILVVGSGPAGVSAAFELLRKGLSVRMLDVGYRLEPDRQQLVDRLGQSTPEQWDLESLESLRLPTDPDVKGLPKKLVYGSDYPYREPGEMVRIESRGVDLLVSHALGGLSNAWGSNILPFLDADTTDWPIRQADLAPYYRSVLTDFDLAGREDRLSRQFPLYTENPRPIRPSAQAKAFVDDLESHNVALSRLGIDFGYSRLALRVDPRNGDAGCVYCGLCLYGCPYGLIYSSAHSLPELRRFPNFEYLPGYYVTRVEEGPTGISVLARRIDGGQDEKFRADRVFLGCGAVSTTKIVLESLGAIGREVLLRDSQYFLSPMLRLHGSKDVTKESLHTLSQVCLELSSPEISERSVHMLVYTYNDLYRRALQKLVGPLFHPFKAVVDRMLSRLLIIQGYLHSDDSPSIAMRVEPVPGSGPTRVVLEGRENPRTRGVIRKVLRRLYRASAPMRGSIVPFMTHVGKPGKSYHVGASLPMRLTPGDFECDVLGRPRGFSRLHVIDASCFTSVPATNVTLTVMANARRIAEQGLDA